MARAMHLLAVLDLSSSILFIDLDKIIWEISI